MRRYAGPSEACYLRTGGSRLHCVGRRLGSCLGRWLPGVAWFVLVSMTWAADNLNPFHLPAPAKSGAVGTVVLHGGGSLSDEIFAKFIELAGGKNARIVLIPSGTYVQGRKDGIEFDESNQAFLSRISRRYGSWVDLPKEGRVEAFRFLCTDNQEDADDPRFVAALKDATGVWIPAAYQGKLDWRFAPHYPEKTSLFQKALRDVLARGGVVGGLGGGMAALPEVMIMGDSGQDAGPAEATVRYGLTLFNGAVVEQNFDARGGRLERFTGLLKDSAALDRRLSWPAAGRSTIGLAVEPETALLLQDNALKVVGAGRAHVFLKSNGDRTITWRIVAPQDGTLRLVSSSTFAESRTAGGDRNAPPGPWRNPFGIPEPYAGARAGTVVLHGGGSNLDLIRIYPGLAGVRQPRLVHCPAASIEWRPSPTDRSSELTGRMETYFHEWTEMVADGRIADIRFLTTSRRTDADNPAFVRPLTDADAVWFSGGDQRELGNLLVDPNRTTRFKEELLNVVRRGGVVGGSSAGAAVMSEIMTVAGQPINGRPAEATIARGLGLLKNVIAEQHFQGAGRGGRIERFTRLLRDNERIRQCVHADEAIPEEMIGLAVEEKTALVLQENRVRVFGQQKAHIFLKSADQKTITWHALQSGDSAFLHHTADGAALELDDWRIR